MGAAVVLIDHVSKENTGKGGRGSSAKRNKLDGSYRVVVNKPFDRHTIGQVTLYRDKDRDGGLEPKLIYSLGATVKAI
jgi:hypothetical protein